MKESKNKRGVSKSFSDLGLNDWLVNQCSVVGIKKPTSVQATVIPEILKGKNCIACDKTGSGKTAAFVLPILQTLGEDPQAMCALVITPTRELAYQIESHFTILGRPLNLNCVVITGGMNHVDQGQKLTTSPHVIIATPGRLADHIRSGTELSLHLLQFIVLDEADRLLEEGYRDDLKFIYSYLPQKRQSLLFSATFSEPLMEVAKGSINKPFVWINKSDIATSETLDERYILASPAMKIPYLVQIIQTYREEHKNSLILIFAPSCKLCTILTMTFWEVGIDCVMLHAEISQKRRLEALSKFKSSQSKIMIATNLSSRGLDIPFVDLVVNFNIPWEPKTYIHRVGRTARAGRGGMAITIATIFDLDPRNNLLEAVEKEIGKKLTKHTVDEKSVAKISVKVLEAVNNAKIYLEEDDFGERKEINQKKRLILEGKDTEEERKSKKRKKDRTDDQGEDCHDSDSKPKKLKNKITKRRKLKNKEKTET